MIRICYCRQPWQLQSRQPLFFFDFVYKQALETFVFRSFPSKHQVLLSFECFGSHLARHWLCWQGHWFNKWLVYGHPHAMYVAMSHYNFCRTWVWVIQVHFGPYLHDYMGLILQICRSSSSKVVGSCNSGLTQNRLSVQVILGIVMEGHILATAHSISNVWFYRTLLILQFVHKLQIP